MVLSTALMCLSLNIYFEARGETVIGQYAVANVTMNRAGHDRKNVCEVVMKHKQFSWTTSRVKDGVLKKDSRPKDEYSWNRAKIIAKVVLDKRLGGFDFTKGAHFYHTKAVTPYWRKAMTKTKVIGSHIFYKLM